VKILIAPDKFKGSLTALQVCEAVQQALLKLNPELTIQSIPLADGGEGTAELLTNHTKGKWVICEVHDPLFRKINAGYGISGDGSVAFIEMASASGLQLLKSEDRNPLKTSTFGTGELIADAINRGVKKIMLAIGGSATNDAGIGMAAALGFAFCDKHGDELQPIGESLEHIFSIDATNRLPKLQHIEFTVLCDVDNPLYGSNGAVFVFARQKGANEQDVIALDKGLQHFARIVRTQLNISTEFAGAGAAGGMGAGAKVFLNATQQRGIDYIIEALQVKPAIQNADLVITGEGKMDLQTLSGKVVAGVTSIATGLNKPVLAIVGRNELSEVQFKQAGINEVISLVDENTSDETAMKQTEHLIERRIVEQFDFTSYKI
jgi:glycerate 2-kinase